MTTIGTASVLRGDALALPLPNASVDAIVTDPPYGLEFMQAEWDGANGFRRSLNATDVGRDSVFGRTSRTSPEYRTGKPAAARIRTRVDQRTNPSEGKSVTSTPESYVAGPLFQRWCQAWATEALRVLKPGGYLLAFGGTRTWHRLTCAIEDAGFEIRDSMAWLYGSGFPKSLDVSKAIDQAAGAEREVIGQRDRLDQRTKPVHRMGYSGPMRPQDAALDITTPATDEARRWSGWGTGLKPGFEPIVVARKPLAGTVAANVLAYGTGALNIDACRIPAGQDYAEKCASVVGLDSNRNGAAYGEWTGVRTDSTNPAGRWPTNVVLGEDAAAEMDEQSGQSTSPLGTVRGQSRSGGIMGKPREGEVSHHLTETGYGDTGGASRFFPVFRYEAKAPAAERPVVDGVAHPTVKPLDLMRWLCRLVTQPGGLVLDPFAGSGTTLEAAMLEGFRAVGVERDASYLPLVQHRIDRARRQAQPGMSRLAGSKPREEFDGQLDILAELGGVA